VQRLSNLQKECPQIVAQSQNHVPQREIANTFNIPSSAEHELIKRFRESADISVHKEHGQKSKLVAPDVQDYRQFSLKTGMILLWSSLHGLILRRPSFIESAL